jgi:carboxylesterase
VGWDEWTSAVDAAYGALAARCDRVVVVGLSMGGTLACWLATRHPEIAGLVCVNPYIEPPAETFLDLLRDWLEHGSTMLPPIGADIARPGAREPAYAQLPVAAMLSLLEAVGHLQPSLARIACPLLLFTSSRDHVVPPRSSDLLAEGVSGPVERVILERSFHVATLDHDAELIERRAVAFAAAVTARAVS